jgi:hypothetical protein
MVANWLGLATLGTGFGYLMQMGWLRPALVQEDMGWDGVWIKIC